MTAELFLKKITLKATLYKRKRNLYFEKDDMIICF